MTLLSEIESYLDRTGMSAKAFGRAAGCGSSIVYDMRRGSEPKPASIDKLRSFLGGMGHVPEARINRQPERIKAPHVERVDSRACFNCGNSGYAGCNCHRPVEILRGVSL
jgi:hypothetical protein